MSKKERNDERSLPSAQAVKNEIKREKVKHLYKKLLKSTIYTLIVVVAIAVLIATLVLPVVQITGNSMEPELVEGDIVALVKTKHLKRGDVCAFYYSNKVLIKRVIGLPGDYIDMDDEGNVYVNGYMLEEPYLTEKAYGECDIEFPYQVPESQYFMLGDQRATSIDSRSTVIGCVAYDQMVGKLILKVWPLKEFKLLG
jgi:signal peptidase I